MAEPAYRRFMDKVLVHPRTRCWIWAGVRDVGGYGYMNYKGYDRAKAHRVSYELFVGEVPQDRNICHHCDKPQCVNPNHLFVGTQKENLQDMYRKGRHAKTHPRNRGSRHPRSKLTEKAVLEIRQVDSVDKALAIKYGINYRYLLMLRRGYGWKHV